MTQNITKSIFKTFLLSLMMVANVHLSYAQNASILPLAKTQFLDANGKPLTSGTVDFYIPSTTTRKTTWQDAAETNPNSNPVVLDGAGRALILGSGSYRQVVKDRNGNVIWDQVTASAGSGGGGGATGDGLPVGTILPWSGVTVPANYLFAYGQELNRTTYAQLLGTLTQVLTITCNAGTPILTGISDTSQIPVGAKVEAACLSGSPTVTAKSSSTITLSGNALVSTTLSGTFFMYGNGNGVNTFNTPDLRGYTLAGRNNMGGAASSVLNSTYFAVNPTDPNNVPDALGARGGNQYAQLVTANLPPIIPTGTISNGAITNGAITNGAITINDPGHIHGSTNVNGATAINNAGGALAFAGGAFSSNAVGGGASFTINSATTGITASQATTTQAATTQATSTFTGTGGGGSSTPYSQIQPTLMMNFIIKVLPDPSAAVSGVASIGGMTGVIACGANVTCNSNTISVTIPSVTAVTSIGGNSGAFTCGAGLTCAGTTMSVSATASAKPLLKFVMPTAFTTQVYPFINYGVGIAPSTSTGTSGVGSVTMSKTVADTWTDILNLNGWLLQTFSYVDPLNGNDANGPACAEATPCKTLTYCMSNCTGITIVGKPTNVFDPFTWDGAATTRFFHRLTFTGPAIIQTAGAGFPLLNAQAWVLESGVPGVKATYSVALAGLVGLSAIQRIMYTDTYDPGTGNNTRLLQYASCAALTAAANAAPANTHSGWAFEAGGKTCISFFGADVLANRAKFQAMYVGVNGDSSIIMVGGVNLFIDSPYAVKLMGTSIQSLNSGASTGMILIDGRNQLFKTFAAPSNGVHTAGGFHYFSGVDCQAAQFDCFNHDLSSTGAISLVINHNSRAWYAGDISNYGTGVTQNRNGISCHGGADCIGAALSMGANYGPNIADTSVTGKTSLSWYTGLETTQSSAAQAGIGFFGIPADATAIRRAWVDTNSTLEETISLFAGEVGAIVKTTNGFYNTPATTSGGAPAIVTYSRNAP